MLCYLRLALDCHDSGSFDYAVNTPIRSVGVATKQKIMGYHLSYWQACEAMISAGLSVGKAAQGIREFTTLIESLHLTISELSLVDALRLIIHQAKLIGWFERADDAQDRIDNLDELLQLAVAFKGDDEVDLTIHEQFLAHACLSTDEEKGRGFN